MVSTVPLDELERHAGNIYEAIVIVAKRARQINDDLEKVSAADGRIQFLLKENPDRKILHTVQVERNGFIHSLVTGTPDQDRGYEYFGERAYAKLIPQD